MPAALHLRREQYDKASLYTACSTDVSLTESDGQPAGVKFYDKFYDKVAAGQTATAEVKL